MKPRGQRALRRSARRTCARANPTFRRWDRAPRERKSELTQEQRLRTRAIPPALLDRRRGSRREHQSQKGPRTHQALRACARQSRTTPDFTRQEQPRQLRDHWVLPATCEPCGEFRSSSTIVVTSARARARMPLPERATERGRTCRRAHVVRRSAKSTLAHRIQAATHADHPSQACSEPRSPFRNANSVPAPVFPASPACRKHTTDGRNPSGRTSSRTRSAESG